MTEATQSGAPTQGENSASGDQSGGTESDLLRRLTEIADGSPQSDGSDDGDDTQGDEGSEDGPQARQPDDAKPDTQGDDAQAADPVMTVKIDGEERQVTRSELIAGYQKGQAAAKRFEEAATLRKSVEQQAAQTAQERAHLRDALTHYTQQLQTLQRAQEPDWQALLETDPTEFQRQRFFFEQRQAQMQQAQAAQAYLTQQQQAEQHQLRNARLGDEVQKLIEALPDWKDPAKAESERAALHVSLKSSGFTPDEIEGLTDHRHVVVARKAMLYDQMMAKQAQAGQTLTQKLAKVPPARAERPGGGAEPNLTDGRTRNMKALNRSGRIEDAAAVLASYF